MLIEDEFKVVSAIDSMSKDQLKDCLRFYVGQSFNLFRENQKLTLQLIDREWGR